MAIALNSNLRFPVLLFDLGSTLIYFDGDWPAVMAEGQAALVSRLLAGGLALDVAVFSPAFQQRLQAYFVQRERELVEHTTAAILRATLAASGYPEVPDGLVKDALQAMYRASQACWHPEAETLPALEALKQRGYRLGMISNAADDADVQCLVDQAGLRGYFDVILTSAAQGIRKPHPRIFQAALATWDAAPSQAVMVGDTLGADIQGARDLGIFSVWLTRRAELPADPLLAIHPDATLEHVGELPALLDALG